MAEAANLEVPGGGGSDANSLILTATSSFSSTLSSSDLDTESITSFFPERGITLGSLIGIAGGMNAMADHDPSSLPHSTRANRGNCRAGRMTLSSVDNTTSSQGISCSHMSRICDNAKLWSLLPCSTCIFANDKGVGKGFCCANKDNDCVVSSATGPLLSSLGHFLIAERDADRDVERLSNEGKVYINIMYEERVEDAAVNPLFDLDSTPGNVGSSGSMHSRDSREMRSPTQLCMQSQGMLEEAGVMLSLCTEDETCMLQAATVARTTSMPPHVEVVPGRTPSLPSKEQKRPDVCELGCVSYMWTRCRF